MQTAFLGDVLLATALIEKLRSYYPGAAIHFMLKKGNESILERHPFLAKVWIWDKSMRKYGHLFNLLKAIRREKFDLLVNVQRHNTTAFFTLFSKARHKVGFKCTPLSYLYARTRFQKKYVHEIERNQALICPFTDAFPAQPRVYVPAQARHAAAAIASLPAPYITISPASLWYTKTYPASKWTAFLNRIPQPLSVYFLGGQKDKKIADTIIAATDNRNLKMKNCCGELRLLPSAALMEKAQMNYTLDSAPTHLASAVNARVSTIFLSTDPIFGFAPCGKYAHIIQHTPPLPCHPCTNHGRKKCPQKHFLCAYEIPEKTLIENLSIDFCEA